MNQTFRNFISANVNIYTNRYSALSPQLKLGIRQRYGIFFSLYNDKLVEKCAVAEVNEFVYCERSREHGQRVERRGRPAQYTFQPGRLGNYY
jgi:hypothetical protein